MITKIGKITGLDVKKELRGLPEYGSRKEQRKKFVEVMGRKANEGSSSYLKSGLIGTGIAAGIIGGLNMLTYGKAKTAINAWRSLGVPLPKVRSRAAVLRNSAIQGSVYGGLPALYKTRKDKKNVAAARKVHKNRHDKRYVNDALTKQLADMA